MGDVTKDSRFSHIGNDPRFKAIPRSQRRVKIDKRFQSMFNDKRFKVKYTVDKRGRPVSKTSSEDLERYYDLSSGSSESGDDDSDNDEGDHSEPGKVETLKSRTKSEPEAQTSDDDSDDSSSEEDGEEDREEFRSNDIQLTDNIKSKLHDMSVDYARGEGAIETDSSSDEESSEDEVEDTVEHDWGELDKDAERTEEVTARLAVCNMDWDRIRAVDLMVLLNSFIPAGGLIRSITIYPSEFGMERMKKEEVEGPLELVEKNSKSVNHCGKDDSEDDDSEKDGSNSSDNDLAVDENEEGSAYHMEKLRQYQLNRLKYFYAIVECDSVNTANHIYTECDGMEYESSATRLDLRFVPDDTTFDQEPRERCCEMPDASKYRPRYFTNTALQQAKVELTWDETDPTRLEIANRLMAGDKVDDNDLQVYLASSSGEEDDADGGGKDLQKESKSNGRSKKSKAAEKTNEQSDHEGSDEEDSIAKYRSLLSGLEEEEQKKKNKDVHMEISWGIGLKEKTEEAVKKRMSSSKELTPFQEMMEKRKEKRREKRKEKLQKKVQNSGENSESEEKMFSDDDIPSDIDMNDPYFTEEYEGLKSNPKKKKRKRQEDADETLEEKQKKAELELLLSDKDDRKHFNFKKIQEEESSNQSKKKKKFKGRKGKESKQKDVPEDDFKVDVDDNRFSALYTSHHFNIDPTDSHFRKSQGMDALISAKQRRIINSSRDAPDVSLSPTPRKKSKKDTELSLLVKSVKSKADKFKKTQ